MSNKTQAQLLKSASTAITTSTATHDVKTELMQKTFVFLTVENLEQVIVENASVAELATKFYMAKKQEFLEANVTVGHLAIAMNHFREGIRTQYGFDMLDFTQEITTEINDNNLTKAEIKIIATDVANDVGDNVPNVVKELLISKTNAIIDQYFIDHPEKTMSKAKETPVVEEVVTNEIKSEDLPKDTAGVIADVILDNTGTVNNVSPKSVALSDTTVGEQVLIGNKVVEVISVDAPDLSTPRERFMQRINTAMATVEHNDKELLTGMHCHDFNPNAKVEACAKFLEEANADDDIHVNIKNGLVNFGEKMLELNVNKLNEEHNARENYIASSFKFKLLNFFGATVY